MFCVHRISNSSSRSRGRHLPSTGSYVAGLWGYIRPGQQHCIQLGFLFINNIIIIIEKRHKVSFREEVWGVLQASDRVGFFVSVWRWFPSRQRGSTQVWPQAYSWSHQVDRKFSLLNETITISIILMVVTVYTLFRGHAESLYEIINISTAISHQQGRTL